MTDLAELLIAGLPLLLVAFGVGVFVGWTERGRWDRHKADARRDEGEQP